MPKVLIILNHTPSEAQLKDLKNSFAITEILGLPEDIKDYLKNVPPDKDLSIDILESITDFIYKNLSKGDYIWIQTEYGITFYIVDFALNNGFIPIYSTTERIYTEKKLSDNEIERNYIFRHVRFRKYIKKWKYYTLQQTEQS